MTTDLTPKFATSKLVDGEFGSYYGWSSSEFPLLADVNVGGGKLSLQPRCLALPHYADCSKVGYVLQGTGGLIGMVFPGESKERVVKLTKGDVIPVPIGGVSWWFNNGDTEFVVVFLGDTSKGYVPGEFTYFLLAGVLGMSGGFSADFNARLYKYLTQIEADQLVKNQTNALVLKIAGGLTMPNPTNNSDLKLVSNIDEACPDTEVKNGGSVATIGVSEMAFFGQVGLSASLVKLAADAMYSPAYAADAAVQMVYVVKGSGRVQIVGVGGKLVLDSEVKVGQMFVVPRLFVAAQLAGDDGMDCFVVTIASQVVVQEFATKTSMWAAFSPQVVQAALNVSPKLQEAMQGRLLTGARWAIAQGPQKARPLATSFFFLAAIISCGF